MTRRPLIGLTTYYKEAAWGDWRRPAAVVPAAYVEAVVAVGGSPVLLPPRGLEPTVVDAIDGLVLVGGADMHPDSYGQQRGPHTEPEPYRDDYELAVTRAALAHRTPVLAICRGVQVLNVLLGGTLHQHVPDVVGHEQYRPAPATYGQVSFTTEPGSRVREILGEQTSAPCYHHQAIDQVAAGLWVTARSADGLVQAVEPDGSGLLPPGGWVVGVQFHPEENHEDLRLFAALVEECRRRAGSGPGREALAHHATRSQEATRA